MLHALVAIPLLAAVLLVFVPTSATALRRRVLAWTAGAFVFGILVVVPRVWLPWAELTALGLGQGSLDTTAEGTFATTVQARWLPTLGVDLSGGLRAVDVFVALALALALVGSGRSSAHAGGARVGSTDGAADADGCVRGEGPSWSWDLAARCGLFAAATGALLTTDAGVRAWCVALAWVASALDLGARSAGARRSGWGGEGLVGGLAVLAASCAAALQSTAAGHAAFTPPLAADAAAAITSPSALVGMVMLVAAAIAAAVFMGIFPLRRWAHVPGEVVDPHAELLRDVAGWAMGIAVLRAAIEAAPGASVAALSGLLWVTAGSLWLVALACLGSQDVHTRRRLFAGFASTVLFGLAAFPSRAAWSVLGLLVMTFTLAGVALAIGAVEAERPQGVRGPGPDGAPAKRPHLAGWVAAGTLLLPFGPGVVVWMVLGRGLSAPLPVGIAAIPLDPVALAATWLGAALAMVACLSAWLAPAVGVEARVDDTLRGATHDGEAHPTLVVHPSSRALLLVVSLALVVPGGTARLLSAADEDAAWRFERWAHHRCQDEAAKASGRAARSHARAPASTVERSPGEGDRCGPAPSRRDASVTARNRSRETGPFTRATVALDALQVELSEAFGEWELGLGEGDE